VTALAEGELRLAPTWARAARRAVAAARTGWWRVTGSPDAGPGVRVLLYHRVCDERDPLGVSVERFAEQLELLADAGYEGVPVSTVRESLSTGTPPRRLVGLSFDDGYRDVAENALPLLRRHGFRASLFVASGLVDGRVRASWYGSRPPPILGWDELRALDAGGELELEGHSVTHRDLVRLPEADARSEIESSRAELEERLGRPVAGFSYPAGRYGERERRLVEAAGYAYAVTCDPGPNGPSTDRFALRRIEVLGSDRPVDFRARLAGAHDGAVPFRSAYRRLAG
jgi:peptidoglycan/xylan/chitin deacetylase (PgdA/CDA1 family)